MRKFLTPIVSLILSLFTLFSCVACQSKDETINSIPEHNITYTHFEIGNVIDEGKQAIFFNFTSDYTVNKIEIAGTLLDKNGNTIDTFDTAITFGTPSHNPKPVIRIEAELIRTVASVSFTRIKAYTIEDLNSI